MTNAQNSTNHAADQSPGHALWRIVTSEFANATASAARVGSEHEFGNRSDFDSLAYREAEEAFNAACARVSEARDKLLTTPAPDTEAVLLKLDVLTEYLTDCDDEDVASVAAIRDDARRLFGGK